MKHLIFRPNSRGEGSAGFPIQVTIQTLLVSADKRNEKESFSWGQKLTILQSTNVFFLIFMKCGACCHMSQHVPLQVARFGGSVAAFGANKPVLAPL